MGCFKIERPEKIRPALKTVRGKKLLYKKTTGSYFPFGCEHQGPWNQDTRNNHLYTGQERQGSFDLEYLRYKKRFGDPLVMGRFQSPDPLSEKFSHVNPFNCSENSPIANIDLWGLQAVKANDAWKLNVNFNINRGLYGGSVRAVGTRYGLHAVMDKGTIFEGSITKGSSSGVTSKMEYDGYSSGEHEVGIEGGLFFGGGIGVNANENTGEKTKPISSSLGLVSYNMEETSKDGKVVEKNREVEVHVAGVSAGVGVIGMELDVSVTFPENMEQTVTNEQTKIIKDSQNQIQQDNVIINKEFDKLK